MNKKLSKYFKHVSKVLSKIDNINFGGCGIAAYSIFLYLRSKDVLTEEFQIITVYNNDDYNYSANFKFLNGEKDIANPAWHIAVTFDRGLTIYDCKGMFTESYKQSLIIPTNKTEEF